MGSKGDQIVGCQIAKRKKVKEVIFHLLSYHELFASAERSSA